MEELFITGENEKRVCISEKVFKQHANKEGRASDWTAYSTGVKRAQGESFGEEMQLLEKGREIHKRSRIKPLDPRLEDGYLVVGGMLQKAQAIPYRARHPKIIDSCHELSQLIIDEMHRSYYHPPTDTGRKNGFSHIANLEQMHSKCMANATFVHVCLNLLKSKDHIWHNFSTHGNARKCHICFKFAVVCKSTDNMVFCHDIWRGSKYDVKTKILQVLFLKL